MKATTMANSPQEVNPLTTNPRTQDIMGSKSHNAQDKKGVYTGTSKKPQKTVTQSKTSATAPSGKFGKARDMGGGKHNFSTGAPGHANNC